MADISIHIVETGELLPVTGIELDQVYNTELITQMLHLLPNIESNKTYKMVGADNKIISSRDTLVNLGISDGDTVSVIAIDNICAVNDTLEDAHLIVRITNSGELIPVYDVDFERDTTDVLIQEIKESLNYNVHLVFDKDGAPVTIPMTFAEMGYSYGDIINVHIGNNFLFSGNERLNISNEDNIKLANLTLIIDQYRIPVNDLELEQVTNYDIICQLVANGIVPEVPGKVYKMVGKNNQVVEETATLAELGFTAGDTVRVCALPCA